MMKLNRTNWLIVLMVSIMPICGFGVDIYTPSLPIITQVLGASHALGKLTISIFIMGFGIGQLFAGPLSDRFGRKIILMISLLIFACASLLAPLCTSIDALLGVRLLQGLAVSGQVLNVRAIAADRFDGAELRKVSIYITTAWTLSPVIGPFIGGYLQAYSGWHAGFYFLAVYSALLFVLVMIFLSESNCLRQSLAFKPLLNNYRLVLCDWGYMKNVLGLMLGYTMINTFNIFGPFIIQLQMHHTSLFYAHTVLIIGCCCFFGSILNRLLVHRVKQKAIIYFCLCCMLSVSLVAGFIAEHVGNSLALLLTAVASIIFVAGMIYPHFSAMCSSMFKSMAGTAAALRGVFTMVGAAMLTGMMSLISLHSIVVLFVIYFVVASLMLMVFITSVKMNKLVLEI